VVTPEPAQNEIKAQVVRVVDGDTVVVRFLPGKAVMSWGDGCRIPAGGGWLWVKATEKVRLIGVNAPETGDGNPRELFGEKAKRYTRKRLLNQVVTLFFDTETRDRYGRLLAYLYLKGGLFNRELVAEGYAQVYTVPPNVKYAAVLLAAQREAIREGRGLWGMREFDPHPVIGNRQSFVYHHPGCTELPVLPNQVRFKNEKEAVVAGYHPCRSCFCRPSEGTAF